MRDLFSNFKENLFEDILDKKNISKSNQEKLKWILNFEWNEFDKVKGIDGRAYCQDSPIQFLIMRLSQYLAYNNEIISSIYKDFQICKEEGINPIFDKYARMMKLTDVDEYIKLKPLLKDISKVKENILINIENMLIKTVDKEKDILPKTFENSRPTESEGKKISSIGYYISEISILSLKSLWAIEDLIYENDRFIEEIYKNTIYLNKMIM